MILSSLSPLFILWAARGTTVIPDIWFIPTCVALAVCPSFVLYWRIVRARGNRDKRQLAVGEHDDARKHLLVYLFATLLPFYRTNIVDDRDLAAMVLALGFIIFLLWHLRLYYINILFALLGYRTFTIYPPQGGSSYTGNEPIVLFSTRPRLREGEYIVAYRITDTVYLEPRNGS